MITFQYKTNELTPNVIKKYLLILGTFTACVLLLAAFLFVLWLVEEVLHAIAEVAHLITTTNPLVITGVLVLAAVWMMGRLKK